MNWDWTRQELLAEMTLKALSMVNNGTFVFKETVQVVNVEYQCDSWRLGKSVFSFRSHLSQNIHQAVTLVFNKKRNMSFQMGSPLESLSVLSESFGCVQLPVTLFT